MSKYTCIVPVDGLADLKFPPGSTLHAPDGRLISLDQIANHLSRGEKIEIYQDGHSIGRFRQAEMADRFSPDTIDVMGCMIEQAKAENFREAINWVDRDKDRFWCPVCAKTQSHPVVVSAWVSPECKPICYYVICKRCGKQGHQLQANAHHDIRSQEALTRINDLAERRLLARYPHIAANLPPDYFGGIIEPETPDLEFDFSRANMLIPNPVEPPVEGELPTQISARKYLVIRFLPIPELEGLDRQSAIVWHLGERYPLITVCQNGEEPEGLEAWFKVEGWSEEACRDLMNFACTLGADPATFDPLCFVHLPGAINPSTGREQTVIYFDPEGKRFPTKIL
jgi:hypothetical protein